jgi:hypothetical protein
MDASGLDARLPEDRGHDLASFASAPDTPPVDALVGNSADAFDTDAMGFSPDAPADYVSTDSSDATSSDLSARIWNTPPDSSGIDSFPQVADARTADSADLGSETGNAGCDGIGCLSNEWQVMGGTPASGIGATYWGADKNLGVFWRGTDNHLKHRRLTLGNGKNAWSDEQDLGGTLASDPAASSRANGVVDVFWRGTDNHLKHRSFFAADGWSREEDLGGTLASAPAAVSWEPFALYVFWRGTDGKLKQMCFDYASNGWRAESDLGFLIPAEPTVMFRSYGIMDVFWRGTDGALQHIWSYDSANWIGVQNLGGTIAAGSSPAATARRDGWIDVVWRGTDYRAKHIGMDLHSHWSPVEDLGGNLASSPVATTTGDGRLVVFAKDAQTGQITHRVWSETSQPR